MTRTKLAMIAAMSMTNGIGRDGGLPWRLKGEMTYFRNVTSTIPESDQALGKQNAVVMGRKTWASIPPKFRPLKGRLNIVISASQSASDLGIASESSDVKLFTSLDQALEYLSGADASISRTFVIGGAQLYADLIKLTPTHDCIVDKLLVTRLLAPNFDCDAFFPEFRTTQQMQDDFDTVEKRKLVSEDAVSPDQSRAVGQQEWTKSPIVSFKQYLGKACPESHDDSEAMLVQESDTWYEYQMWERKMT